MHRILIKNGIIVPMDGNNRTIENKALLIEENGIAAIDSAETLVKKHDINQTIDAGGKVVMPGIVNCHAHQGWTSLCRGIAEDMTVEDYIFRLTEPLIEHVVTDEDMQCFAYLDCVEMLKFGNTCISEFETFSDDTASAIMESGIRGVLGVNMTDADWDFSDPDALPNYNPDLKKKNLDKAIKFYDTWQGKNDGRISVRFSNNVPLLCSPELLTETKILAKERGIGVNTHINAEPMETEAYQLMYQKTGVEFISDVGYLDENTNLVHMIYTKDREIDIVKETNAYMIHCPFEMGKRGACAPLGKMYAADLNMALGSDWLMMDPFEQMRFAAVLARVNSGDALLKNAYDFLEMFTIKAAKALDLDDKIGSLEIGKLADIILVDFDQPHIVPMNSHYDPVTNLVYNVHGSDVSMVIIDGEIVVENGKVNTIDEQKAMEDANIRSEAVFNKFKSLDTNL